MKTISKRFLKGALAMLLAVVMLFGTTITGFAAVVDNADTSANVDLVDTSYDISSGKRVYYIDTASWGACQMYIWKDSDGYNTYYTLSKIANTKIYQYNFSGGWSGYSGFKFRSNTSWSKQSAGDIKTNISSHTWFNGTSTTSHTNMDGLNGEAKVVTMISTDGGSTYTATADPNVYTTVSGYNVASGASSTTNVSSSTTASSSASIEAAYGSTITYTANATGATFKGLSSTNSSTLPSSFVSTSSTYTKTATGYNTTNNTTYYAYYVLDTAETYTVTYDAGNGSNAPASQTKTEGENLTLSTDEPTAPTGYYFVGWNTQADGQGDTYLPGGTYAVDEDVTLYAQYAKSSVTYTFKDYDGTVLKTDTVDSGTDVSNLAPTPTAREGYEHSGWTPTLGTITSDTEFSPNYTPINYTITLDPNDGTVDGGNTITYTIESDAITLPTPTYGNNVFEGWVDANGNKVTTVPAGSTGDKSYTAQWTMTYAATAHNYVNKVNDANGTYGCTVTVNGSASPVYVKSGESVTFEATPNTNYEFFGWYSDDSFATQVSTDATYTTTMTETGVTLYALFIKNFYLRDYTSKENAVTFKYDVATDSYSSDDNAFVEKFTVISDDGKYINDSNVKLTTDTCVGISSITGHYTSYYILTADTVNYDTSKPVTYTLTPNTTAGTYKLNIALTEAQKFNVTFDGETTAHAANSTVTLTVDCPAGQYLSSASVTPDLPMEFAIDGSKISFTMPEQDIAVTPVFANYSYVNITDTTGITATGLKTGYKAGEAVTITLSPASAATTITDVVADNDSAVVTQNGDNWTVTIDPMPADTTITLTPTVDAKFVMNYGTAAIGNYGTGVTSGFGTVTMKIGDTTLAQGGYAGPTDTVTYTASESNANYTFAGFYSNADCTDVLTYDNTYSVQPTKDTTVYTLWARRQYMDFDSGTASYVKELVYDKKERVYTLSTVLADNSSANAISKGAWFQVTNDKNSWTAQPSYHHYGSDFTVSHNNKGFDATISWNDGGDSWKLSTSAANDTAIKFILTPTGNTAIDFSAQVGEVGSYIYLSSGRLDLPGSYNATVFEANISYTHEGATNPADVYVANEGENREKYKRISLTDAQTISFETEITGTAAANYEVDSYVVYHIDTKSYSIVTPVSLGNNKYSGSVLVDGPCYIVPIYFLTAEYAEANNLAEIDIYFDATAIQDQAWGPFVACYAWGSNGAEYHGGWSGQMMIPDESGETFYTMLTVPKAGATGAPSIPNGVTFNNYTQSTVPGSNPGAFGISATQYQCYDYREPITLYEAGYDVITFVAKDSTDGYHGDRANGVTANTVTSSTTDIFNKYDFDYLYCRDGVTPMDFNGDAIDNPVDLSTGAKADYYVINKGDITYDPNGTKYVGDTNFDADWAVDWYIFDSDGKFITNILSTAMWHDKDNDLEELYTYLHEALGTNKAGVAGKTVAISYEHENNAGHQVSYDGQWYGNHLDDTVNAQVKVGFQTGENQFTINSDTENPNIADYGEGYLDDLNGGLYQTLDVDLDYGAVDLHAVRKDGYTFVGWYTQKADGTYHKIASAFDYHTYISMNETYYAMFREIEEGEVIINHSTYINNDPAIPSHGGVSEMSIVVTDNTDGTVYNCTPSTSRTSVSFEGKEGRTYTVKIITTPLMNGEFFAWYTDSFNADGTKTYEEVFTDDTQIGSTAKVEATFEYEYTHDSQKIINIYSDVRRVSNKADLFYKYQNRFGNWCTYTVRDVELNDDECTGYEGNDNNPYVPTYITKYTLKDGTVVYGEEALGDQSYDSSYNAVQMYAPSPDVTEVFNGTVKWTVSEKFITTEKSLVTLVADQGVPEYKITYTIDNGTPKTVSGYYNELADIEAPVTNDAGDKFLYWWDIDEEQIISYYRFYSYRFVENKNIKAVYGAELGDVWTPIIDSVTYTREYQDTSDYIYTDYLLTYSNSQNKILDEEIDNGADIQFGLILARDPAVAYDGPEGSVDLTYPTFNETDLKEVALGGNSKALHGINYYCYDKTGSDTTIFNRMDFFLRYDNNKLDKYGVKYCQYTFTAVAYIVVDGVVTLSDPVNVNFWGLANTAVSDL